MEKSTPNNVAITRTNFKVSFVDMIKFPMQKDVLKLSQGVQAPLQLVFDGFVLFLTAKVFVDQGLF